MTDFLKAEWKTLVLLGLAGLAVYALLIRESKPPASETQPATVEPGVSIDGITVGADASSLERTLGPPRREPADGLGVVTWHWDEPPISASVYEGTVTTVERRLDDGFRPRLESGTVLGPKPQLMARDLGNPLADFTVADDQKIIRYHGLMLKVNGDGELVSVAVTGVRTEAAAHR